MTLIQLYVVSSLEMLDVLASHIHSWQYLFSFPSEIADTAYYIKSVKAAQRWFYPRHHWHQVSFFLYEGNLIRADWMIGVMKPSFHVGYLPLGRVGSCLKLRMVPHESLCLVILVTKMATENLMGTHGIVRAARRARP